MMHMMHADVWALGLPALHGSFATDPQCLRRSTPDRDRASLLGQLRLLVLDQRAFDEHVAVDHGHSHFAQGAYLIARPCGADGREPAGSAPPWWQSRRCRLTGDKWRS